MKRRCDDTMFSANSSFDSESTPLHPGSDGSMAPPRLPTATRVAIVCVFANQILMAIGFTAISSLVYTYSHQVFQWSRVDAVTISMFFLSVTYITPFLGGILADVKFGCYKIAFTASCIAMIGQIVAFTTYTVSLYQQNYLKMIRAFHLIGIMLVALAQGLINVSSLPLIMRHMNTESMSESLCKDRRQMVLRWYVFFYGLGELITYLVLSDDTYSLHDVSEPSALVRMSMPMVCTALGAFAIILGKRYYARDNVAVGRRRVLKFVRAFLLYCTSTVQRKSETSSRRSYRKHLLRLVVLQFVAFITLSAYLAIYYQADSTYVEQIHNVTKNNSHIALSDNMGIYRPVGNLLTIIAMAFYARFLNLCHHWHRVAAGIGLAACSTFCACVIEWFPAYWGEGVSVFYLISEFGLLGISEAFYWTGGFEMSYAVTEEGMDAVTLGMFLGVGSTFGLFFYMAITLGSLGSSTDIPHMYLFLALALIAVAVTPLFAFVANRCEQARRELPDDPAVDSTNPHPPYSETDDSMFSNRPVAIWDNF